MNQTLLIIGRAATDTQFPAADETWTTLSAFNELTAIHNIPNLHVWDCHKDTPNPYNRHISYDISRERKLADELIESWGRTFANQICWMLALATQRGHFASITMIGCDFSASEYIHEVQYVAYHLGACRAGGIGVTIIPPSALLRPSTYGRTK